MDRDHIVEHGGEHLVLHHQRYILRYALFIPPMNDYMNCEIVKEIFKLYKRNYYFIIKFDYLKTLSVVIQTMVVVKP